MLMVNVDLFDILYFIKSDDVIVTMDKEVCKMEDNLVYKTAMYIKNKYNVNQGIDITIKKNIPDQAGLGGGSSDAACTILSLNKIWKLNLSENDLIDIASHIGSDVPFFLYNRLSVVKGRGEKIEAVYMIPGWTHNIINLSKTENLVTVMTCNEIFNKDRPDTFFEIVN